MPAVFFRHDVE